MDITPLVAESTPLVQRYNATGFTIGGAEHRGAVLILPAQVVAWDAGGITNITEESLTPLFTADPPVELLLIGTGSRTQFLPPSLRDALRQHGIVTEAMDTPAAARTFNVLLTEGRRVAAALLPAGS